MTLPSLDLFARAVDAVQEVDPSTEQYGYVPSVSLGVIFIVLFSLTAALHLGQLIYARRYYFMVCMVIGGLLEVLGWAGRLWSHYAPSNFSPYVMQICCLVIAPTFYSASLYWAAGLAIAHVAPDKSFFSGKAFKAFFITADVVSLVVQAVGGGMAGSAVGTDPDQVKTGSNIMLAGIVIQLVVMVVYVALMVIWTVRAKEQIKLAGRRLQWMLGAMLAASLGIIIRGCYRTPELSEGFDGWIATQQIWMLFDAVPVAFSSFVLNVIHPHWFLVYSSDLASHLPMAMPTVAEKRETEPSDQHDALEMQPTHRSDSQETAVGMAPAAGWPSKAPEENYDARFLTTARQV
ncbi:hypothetical protein JCM3774_003390 [Rhodotorula dairenensis]